MEPFTFMLAPMEGLTGPPFRERCVAGGCDLTFTEMARVSALARGNKSTLEKTFIPSPIPTQVQLICSNEKDLQTFLGSFVPPQGFRGFNLNLGCASPDMVKKGLGCALVKRVNKVNVLINTIRGHGHPVSVKMRLGLNAYEKQKKAYLNLIKNTEADFYVVHARHGGQTLKDPADISVYPEIVRTGKTIIANGDITTPEQVRHLRDIGVMGVMIGRAAVSDPGIFTKLKTSH